MKQKVKFYFIVFLFILFFIGAYLYSITDLKTLITKYSMHESMGVGIYENMDISAGDVVIGDKVDICADLLIKKGNALLLYNTKKPDIEGENPITFYTLDEYIHYLESQKKKGINCPVLYLQEESNAQGGTSYRVQSVQDVVLPSAFTQPLTPQLLPQVIKNTDANILNPPYNQNMYSGYDATSQNVGRITELDLIHASTEKVPVSDNAMDTNWGGIRYSQAVIASGKYDDNVVSRINYPTPKGGMFLPIPNPYIPARLPDA